MLPLKVTPKAEETGIRILDAAPALFRQGGFDSTPSGYCAEGGVATGAAYSYYPSKEAIVMGVYQRSLRGHQHGFCPAEFWRSRSEAIIQRFRLRVLSHVRMAAEQGSERSW